MKVKLVPVKLRRRRRLPESVTILAEWRWVYDLRELDAYYGAAGRCEGMGL